MLKGLLLDFYGTVVSDDDEIMAVIAARVAAGARVPARPGDVLAAWSRAFQEAADGTPFRRLRDCAGDSLAAVMESFGCPGDAAELCAPQFAYWPAPPLRAGVREFLAGLRVPVCVVSDADRADLDAAMSLHGLTFDAVVCSEEVGAYKPDRAMFGRALSALGLTAGEVLHVGDSLSSDVAGAVASGIPVVWINRLGRPAPPGVPLAAEVTGLADLTGHPLLHPHGASGVAGKPHASSGVAGGPHGASGVAGRPLGASGAAIARDGDRYRKESGEQDLPGEAARLTWLRRHGFPAAEVLESAPGLLVTRAVPGRPAAAPRPPAARGRVLDALADLTRALHALPVADCPFDRRLDVTIPQALAADPDLDDLDDERAGWSRDRLVAALLATRPPTEDLVVCHGDLTGDNVIIGEDGERATVIDAGRLGLADRWSDLALVTRDLSGPEEERFLRRYGTVPDPARRDFYRLLDEFF